MNLLTVADLSALLADLDAEGAALDSLLTAMPTESWSLPTPSDGWNIAFQVAHLAWTDEASLLAVVDEAAFLAEAETLLAQPKGFIDRTAAVNAELSPEELLVLWRTGRASLSTALAQVVEGRKLKWFGPSMSAASMATARLMETWAHGYDIADALEVRPVPTARLRHVAHIGVRTRDFAFTANKLEVPTEEFRIELDTAGLDAAGVSSQEWVWGPEGAAQRVSGSALDFCLLVTQRRHLEDLDLVSVGTQAARWLTIAQTFAGPVGGGRAAGQFAQQQPEGGNL
ncbi:unannotated protein [freshwater metagenome]|uniref:Unannotated protein n=1 Tax=freshwater metagenome TaxID=449393 RepID=A0A6J7NIP6_9ZZZZ